MSSGYWPAFSARTWVYCSACCAVAGVISQTLEASWAFLLVLVEHTLERYHLLLSLVHLLHGFLQRDGVVERDVLCAWVGCWSLCSLLVASMVDSVVFCPCLAAGLVRVYAPVFKVLARVDSRASSPAQIRGQCQPAYVLPQRDGIVSAREGA